MSQSLGPSGCVASLVAFVVVILIALGILGGFVYVVARAVALGLGLHP